MNRVYKNVISIAIALMVIGGLGQNAHSYSDFLDVDKGIYYEKPIQYLAGNGLINGYEDGTFRPKKEISRAEAVQIVVNAFQLSGTGRKSTFTDTNNHWAERSGAISIAQEAGVISGDGSGKFRPNDTITRAEVAQIIVNTAGIELAPGFTMNLTDLDQVPWAKHAITILYSNQLVSGKEGNRFDPKGRTIRGEFSTMVYNVLMIKESSGEYAGLNQTEVRRIDNIKEQWQALQPRNQTTSFEVTPSITAPYALGKLNDGVLKDALDFTNFVRHLSKLPDDIVLNKQFNADAQAAALVNAVNQSMSHYPSQPQGMDNELYKQGYDAAGVSNIAYGYSKITDSIEKGYMPDDSASNRETVGHRRWILSPYLRELGFGYVQASDGVAHTAMKVNAPKMWENTEAPYRGILWPSETVFPVDFLGKNDPWSISLNPENYDAQKRKDITVTLTRLGDQKKWHFAKQGETSDGYFKIDTQEIGYTPFTLIFQPNQMKDYQAGERYRVEVKGLYTKSGGKTDFKFETMFFKLDK